MFPRTKISASLLYTSRNLRELLTVPVSFKKTTCLHLGRGQFPQTLQQTLAGFPPSSCSPFSPRGYSHLVLKKSKFVVSQQPGHGAAPSCVKPVVHMDTSFKKQVWLGGRSTTERTTERKESPAPVLDSSQGSYVTLIKPLAQIFISSQVF